MQTKQQRCFYFLNESQSIGRTPNCDIWIDLPSISKRHALIIKKQEGYLIEDCDSANGIYVNQYKVHQYYPRMGDVVFIGGILLYFYDTFIGLSYCDQTTLKALPWISHKPIKEILPSSLIVKENPPSPPVLEKQHLGNTWFMMLYPMLYFMETRKVNAFMLASLLMFWLHLVSSMKVYLTNHKRLKTYKKALAHYQTLMLGYYPSSPELVERYLRIHQLIHRKGDICVRIGTLDRAVVIHNFTKYPRLVLMHNEGLMQAMILQLALYYPHIELVFSDLKDLYWPINSRLETKDTQFYIGNVPKGEMGIEFCTTFQACSDGYDGLIEGNNYIVDGKKQVVSLDNDFKADYYAMTFSKKVKQPKSFVSCLKLHEHSISYLRSKQDITQSLKGLIGEDLYLDLREGHLLVAGMTGSGKSEWLHTYLLSMAILYDSRYLNFFIVDFKGGGLSEGFKGLAHTTMTLTNLEPHQIKRALEALKLECLERQQRFLETGEKNLNLSQYLKLGLKPIPHLFIVIDEFAELKQQYPEVIAHLIQIARIGRSLGIHLVLSTQQPSGIVDSQILGNLANRVCLKTATPQDSYDIIYSKKAAELTQPGDFYLKQQGKRTLIFGHSPLISKQAHVLYLYDEKMHLCHTLKKMEETNYFYHLRDQINHYSKKAKPLYYETFIEIKGSFAVIDDYEHRQMVAYQPKKLLLLGCSQLLLEKIKQSFPNYTYYPLELETNEDGIYYTQNKQLSYRQINAFEDIMVLDESYLNLVSPKKVVFKVNLACGDVILFLKGEAYLCRLQCFY